jgi:hypothetical protein
MNSKSAITMNNKSIVGNTTSWLFGIVAMVIGLINTFWGNDPGYGVFIILLSFVYFPPATDLLKKKIGISIPLVVKIVLGLFILWSALGVAELFDKIDLMMQDF